MKSVSFLLSPLSSLAARLRRSRPGSVLIIVIVLLLLLAILGAAYISTTRSARVASAQNTINSDVDDMIGGVAKVCEGTIVDDLNDTFGDLHGNTAYTSNTGATAIVNRSYYQGQAGANPNISTNVPPATGYSPGDIVNDALNVYNYYTLPQGAAALPGAAVASPPWTHVGAHLPFTAIGVDPWLADRIPTPQGNYLAKQSPIWTALTQTIQYTTAAPGGSPASILGTPFVDPTTGQPLSQLTTPLICNLGPNINPVRQDYITLANGINVPGLAQPYNTANKFAAADADGDGIADALFFAIPGAAYDGLTWYGAVRIIDNNSAINANTAWSRDALTFYSGGADNWNLFQTSVGLQEIINAGDSANFTKFNGYRFGTGSGGAAGQQPVDDTAISTGIQPPNSYGRLDFDFISQSDAQYNQLIRRIGNPGINSTGGNRYQPFPLSDEAALAYHFCCQNPNSMAQSVLETFLPNSLDGTMANPVQSTPFDASMATSWFNGNFLYPLTTDAVPAPVSLRPLLVTYNPVSNYVQQVCDNNDGTAFSSEPILPNSMLPYGPDTVNAGAGPHFKGIWSPTPTKAYVLNDIVVYPSLVPSSSVPGTSSPSGFYEGPSYTFILVNPAAGGTAPATFNANNVLTAVTAGWELQPWSSNPVKANVNTASFPELFRAFWSVMAGNPSNATPFGTTGIDGYNIYDATAPTSTVTTGNPQAMFRSPLRDPTSAVKTANVTLLDAPNTTGTVTNTNTMLLRAALASANAIALRNNSQNIVSQTIALTKNSQINNGAGGTTLGTVELQVYSNAPQPVISEIYANTYNLPDSSTNLANPQGYVAVELYNPYPVTLTLTNWQLGLINRTGAGGTYPNLYFQTNPPATGTPPQTPVNSVSVIGPMQTLNNPVGPKVVANVINIPPHGYALLENYNGSSTPTGTTPYDALCRPVSALYPSPPAVPTGPGSFYLTAGHTPVQTTIWYGPGGVNAPTVCDVFVPNLQLVIAGTKGATITGSSTGGELVLLRPRRIDGEYSSQGQTTYPNNYYNEGTTDVSLNVTSVNLWELVPIDSFDFTGLTLPASYPFPVLSYIRQKGAPNSVLFNQFFPGFYDATQFPRQGGAGLIADINSASPGPLGQSPTWTNPFANPAFGIDATACTYTNNFPPIQIFNIASGNGNSDAMHFPNALVSAQSTYPNGVTPPGPTKTYLYPFGGFPRNGDMLDIPFVGAYRIRINISSLPTQVATSNFLELNSLPMDCSLAAIETGVAAEDGAENIGRFMPMASTYYYASQMNPTPPVPALPDYYSWTRNLFNYLTVQSGTDAYAPNVDPNYTPSVANTFAYPPQNVTPIPPTPTLTASGSASDQTLQDNVGVEGLININTASWKVLSMLPFVPNNPAVDQQIAQNIVNYRLTYGPFTSIFDLNNVPGFQSGTNVAWAPPTPIPAPTTPPAPTSATGLLSPADQNFGTSTAASSTVTGIKEDYQWDTLTLDRISNLITTRSDTFTIYIELQGWQNVGSANAQPMITRRYAYIVDRSAINGDPGSRFLKTLTVPNN